METYLYIALFSPLVGSLFAGLFGNSERKVFTGVVTSMLLGVSLKEF